jgi:hypothetical protein
LILYQGWYASVQRRGRSSALDKATSFQSSRLTVDQASNSTLFATVAGDVGGDGNVGGDGDVGVDLSPENSGAANTTETGSRDNRSVAG